MWGLGIRAQGIQFIGFSAYSVDLGEGLRDQALRCRDGLRHVNKSSPALGRDM